MIYEKYTLTITKTYSKRNLSKIDENIDKYLFNSFFLTDKISIFLENVCSNDGLELQR